MPPQNSSSGAQPATAMADAMQINLQSLMSDLFLVLTEKEKEIISRRFSLQGQPKQTLEKIGKHFNVTRERIRQIEHIALSKLRRTVGTTRLTEVNRLAKTILRSHGGVMLDEDLITAVLKRLAKSSPQDASILKLSLTIDSDVQHESRSSTMKPFWHFLALSLEDIRTICNSAVKLLKRKGSCISGSDLVSALQHLNLFPEKQPMNELLASCLTLDTRLREIDAGWGLTEWRFVRPRSIRDKVEIILKKEGKPLHFVDIANKIRDAHFDHKNVTIQAVHNELIRYPQFVLVGRGLYALREWGYEPGTVADVIERILKEKGPLSKKEIIEEVSKQRKVKVGTISLNLQKMPYFVRVGRAVYDFDPKKK